jgi:hypothetical protein
MRNKLSDATSKETISKLEILFAYYMTKSATTNSPAPKWPTSCSSTLEQQGALQQSGGYMRRRE